jgi:hypothetical protein
MAVAGSVRCEDGPSALDARSLGSTATHKPLANATPRPVRMVAACKLLYEPCESAADCCPVQSYRIVCRGYCDISVPNRTVADEAAGGK